jgi:hypothetical protein
MKAQKRQVQSPAAAPAADRAHGSRAAGVPGIVLALQRTVGNRAARRALARWTKHPDATKKGIVVPDVVAAEFTRFNPPKNE